MALNHCCLKWRITWQERVMEVQDSGMKRVLRLRDGDSERGSGMQRKTGTRLGGAQTRRATAGAQPDRGGEGFLLRREIEHKALLPQVQALYTRATYYLVSNYKTISHQA